MTERQGSTKLQNKTRATPPRFPEANSKIVESIELTATADYYGIDVNFTDNTAMVFSQETNKRPAREDVNQAALRVVREATRT